MHLSVELRLEGPIMAKGELRPAALELSRDEG